MSLYPAGTKFNLRMVTDGGFTGKNAYAYDFRHFHVVSVLVGYTTNTPIKTINDHNLQLRQIFSDSTIVRTFKFKENGIDQFCEDMQIGEHSSSVLSTTAYTPLFGKWAIASAFRENQTIGITSERDGAISFASIISKMVRHLNGSVYPLLDTIVSVANDMLSQCNSIGLGNTMTSDDSKWIWALINQIIPMLRTYHTRSTKYSAGSILEQVDMTEKCKEWLDALSKIVSDINGLYSKSQADMKKIISESNQPKIVRERTQAQLDNIICIFQELQVTSAPITNRKSSDDSVLLYVKASSSKFELFNSIYGGDSSLHSPANTSKVQKCIKQFSMTSNSEALNAVNCFAKSTSGTPIKDSVQGIIEFVNPGINDFRLIACSNHKFIKPLRSEDTH